MKNKQKRDKETIDALNDCLDKAYVEKNKKDAICRKLVGLCITEGVDSHKIFEMIEGDHFLRKML